MIAKSKESLAVLTAEHAERLLRKPFRSGVEVGTLLEWGLLKG
jgi:hypothetical protein